MGMRPSKLTTAFVRLGAIGAVAGFCFLPPRAGAAAGGLPTTAHASTLNRFAEHRYRIIAKIRLALFWAGRDNVGSARMTWRSDGQRTAVALLAGSDPQRVPGRLNQWGYLREEIDSDQAEVFTLRSLNANESAPPAAIEFGDGPRFGVSCASMRDRDVSSSATTVNGSGMTYRMFDRLLDQIALSRRWQERHTTRPPGTDAGFLTALQRLIQRGRTVRAATDTVTYIYNNTLYELRVHERETLGRTIVGNHVYADLIRDEFAIRNRTTSDVTRFAVTYAPDESGPALPVQIFYQPSFWIRVELRLDDAINPPADPAEDHVMLEKIRAICGGAASTALNRH